MTITGKGLKGTSATTIVVDGVACEVTSQTSTEIKCTTGAKDLPTASGIERPGQLGLKKVVYDPTDAGTTPSYDVFTDPIVETSLATSTETTMRYDVIVDDTADQTKAAN